MNSTFVEVQNNTVDTVSLPLTSSLLFFWFDELADLFVMFSFIIIPSLHNVHIQGILITVEMLNRNVVSELT